MEINGDGVMNGDRMEIGVMNGDRCKLHTSHDMSTQQCTIYGCMSANSS